MPKIDIRNCRVEFSGGKALLSCDYNGDHYHVWLDPNRTILPPLYKNPPKSVPPGSAGHYWTRKLTLTSKLSSTLIGKMTQCMQQQSLYENALTAKEAQLAEEKRQQNREAPNHLVVGTDAEGRMVFVTENGDLSPDINEAGVFAAVGLEQAQRIAQEPDLKQRRICRYLTVITLTAGQLEALTAPFVPDNS